MLTASRMWRNGLNRKYGAFLLTCGIIVPLDQLTKIYISSIMALHESYTVVPGVFNIAHVRNPGAAFGFLADASAPFRSIFFTAVGIAAIGVILYLLKKVKDEEFFLVVPLSLVLSGAIGNLIDRIRLGEVIDFLDFHIGPHHWPAFNIADSAISIGAVLLIYFVLNKKKTA